MRPSNPPRYPLGICTSVLGHRLSLTAEKIRRLAATEIEYLELSALQQLHLDMFDDKRIDELLAAATAAGVRIWSIHAPFCGFAMDDADTRIDGVRLLGQTLRTAARFGASCIVVHPGRDTPSVDRRRELAWTHEAMARAVDLAPDGVRVALETMGAGSLAGPADEMLAALDGLDPNRAGVCLDSGHVHQGGDVAAYIGQIAGRIATVHLHDNHGDRDAHALPGRGTIDWPGVLQALHAADYSGVLMCEGGDPDGSAEDAVADYIDHMGNACRQAFG